MIPAAKLDRLLDRFAAIESEMASGASGEAFVKLSREHAQLAPVIETALWPVATVVLLAPQRRAPEPDANRPL